ncbi:MAG: ATP-binding protein [Desulfovibrio sp.]|nr:ATP-binding protein [Desulfovibrio sp.]
MPSITLPATVTSIQDATDFLRKQLDGKNKRLLEYVELAAEELLINVVNYAYADDIAEKKSNFGKLVLGCRWVNLDGHDHFCFWVRDWGRPFDPFRSVCTPDISLSLEDREVGGLGVHLIKHISSHCMYSGTDGSNTVELYFRVDEMQ